MNRSHQLTSQPSPQEATKRRKDAAQKAAKTRRLRKASDADEYAKLLLALRDAHQHSEQAKNRPADGMRFRDYRRTNRSRYAWHAYTSSREARERDYAAKKEALEIAAKAAGQCGIVTGFQFDNDASPRVPYVLYFDLTVGQVSFHSESHCELPTYDGNWDGVLNAAGERIEAAIEEYLM